MREPWTDVTDDEMRAFLGLYSLYSSRRLQEQSEPVSYLWSEQDGRPVFAATMSRARYTDILKYIRFDDKATRES